MRNDEPARKGEPAEGLCLARSLAGVLQTEPALEAVTLSPQAETLSLATFGKAASGRLEDRINQAVADGASSGTALGCGLLSGANDCASCTKPLEAELRSRITVSRSDSGVTFARVTCPTAPAFWSWRKLPIPRFVQRELEPPKDQAHLDEW